MAILSENTKAPNFSLINSAGKNKTLADYKSGYLVLYFYPKDDTSGCTLEAQTFTSKLAEFKKLNCSVVGVSPDDTKSHCKFMDKYKLEVELLSDPEKKTLSDYGVWVEKSMYGRKYMGVERSTFLIDKTGTIKKIWRKVSVPGHVEEVLGEVKKIK